MSELWRMERKRDKNAREMKVPGPGTRPGPGGGRGPLMPSRAPLPSTSPTPGVRGGQPAPAGRTPSTRPLAPSLPGPPQVPRASSKTLAPRKPETISHTAPKHGPGRRDRPAAASSSLPCCPGSGILTPPPTKPHRPIPGLCPQDLHLPSCLFFWLF